MIRESYDPIFVETDFYSKCEFDYLFQDLPVEFQKALQENRPVNSKDLKKMLKRLFPGTKFYVRRDSYSINVYYVNGPAKEKVEKVVDWDTQGFNGMYDISYSKTYKVLMSDMSLKELEFDWYGYVFVRREYTREALEKFLEKLKTEGENVDDIEIKNTSFYVGSKKIIDTAYLQCNDWKKQNELLELLSKTDF